VKSKRLKIISAKAICAALFLICCVFGSALETAAQKKKTKPAAPENVVDYLKILPKSYSKIIAANSRADRLSLIKYDRRKSGFLRLGAKNFMGYAEIALFKKKSGGYLVAVNEYAQNVNCCDGSVSFYEYDKGKWREVDPLPRFSYGDLLTAFHGKTKRQPTSEEMEMQILEMHEPTADEITLQIGGVAVYGFRWNGNDFDSGMLYLLDEK
jgi:hypothetical protein